MTAQMRTGTQGRRAKHTASVRGRAAPGPAQTPVHAPHTGRTAQRPRVRAQCAAIPARSPLLPALTRSLRAASVFLTSPPQRAETVRSGTLQLYYTSKQTGGGTNPETHWGTRNRPRPRKTTAPVPGSPDPSCLPPKTTTDPAAPTTEEGASTTHPAARRLRKRPWDRAQRGPTGQRGRTANAASCPSCPCPTRAAHPATSANTPNRSTPDTPKGALSTRECPHKHRQAQARRGATRPSSPGLRTCATPPG